MSRFLPVAVGVIILATCTYFQGVWTQRWSNATAEELKQLAGRYELVPAKIGVVWIGDDVATNKRHMYSAGAHAHISRRYRNIETGEVISVFLILGFARNVAVHTPDACYVSSGYEMERPPTKFTIPGSDGQPPSDTFTSTFLKENLAGGNAIHQRIFWTWTNGSSWTAPDNPRMKYSGHWAINKVYLISDITSASRDIKDDPAIGFGTLFLPIVIEKLYSPTAESDKTEKAPSA